MSMSEKSAFRAMTNLVLFASAMENMRLSIQEREARLELMSQTDGLTKLHNRPFFDKAMEISLANSRRNLTQLTLVMIDIDHFKSINDAYGHQAGDLCLQKIAGLLRGQYKRSTDVVARYGGEEFIAILYGQSLDEAFEQTEKLRQAIEAETIHHAGNEIKLTASFGLATMVPPAAIDSLDLIGMADAALYKAKDEGRKLLACRR